jgi:hypothetical protein
MIQKLALILIASSIIAICWADDGFYSNPLHKHFYGYHPYKTQSSRTARDSGDFYSNPLNQHYYSYHPYKPRSSLESLLRQKAKREAEPVDEVSVTLKAYPGDDTPRPNLTFSFKGKRLEFDLK